MNTVQIEIGLIGDFLSGSFSAHPSPLKGGEGAGLRPEHFTDPSARAAFEIIRNAHSQDPEVLRSLLITKMGVDFCEKAITFASEIPAYADDRLRRSGDDRLARQKRQHQKPGYPRPRGGVKLGCEGCGLPIRDDSDGK